MFPVSGVMPSIVSTISNCILEVRSRAEISHNGDSSSGKVHTIIKIFLGFEKLKIFADWQSYKLFQVNPSIFMQGKPQAPVIKSNASLTYKILWYDFVMFVRLRQCQDYKRPINSNTCLAYFVWDDDGPEHLEEVLGAVNLRPEVEALQVVGDYLQD